MQDAGTPYPQGAMYVQDPREVQLKVARGGALDASARGACPPLRYVLFQLTKATVLLRLRGK